MGIGIRYIEWGRKQEEIGGDTSVIAFIADVYRDCVESYDKKVKK